MGVFLCLVVAGAFAAVLFRHAVRALWLERVRLKAAGPLQWFEVVQESGHRSGPYGPTSFGGLRTLMHMVNDVPVLAFWKRPVVSFVWIKSAQDKDHMVRLLAGISEASGPGGVEALHAYARSIGARLEPTSSPELPVESVAIALRHHSDPYQVKPSVSDVGSLADTLAAVMQSGPSDATSAVVITLDGMGPAEQSMLAAAVQSALLRRGGNASIFASGAAGSIQQMCAGSVRLGVAAASDSPHVDFPRSLIRSAMSSVSTFGYAVKASDPASWERKDAVKFVVPALVGIAGCAFFGQPAAVFVIGLMLLVGLFVGHFVAARFASAGFKRRLGSGVVPMPEFVPRPLSIRRALEVTMAGAGWRSWLRRADSEDQQRPAAFPSGADVLSAHEVALFEMLTFPRSAEFTAVDRLQSRGLPPNMVDVDEGIFVGISGTGQPVYLDLMDIEHTLYAAGTPNSGKSNLLLAIFAGVVKACRDRTAGLQISPIWGETKGEGAYDAWRIASRHPQAVFVDVHNPLSGYRLALEGMRLSEGESVHGVTAACTRLVSAFQAAYGDGIRAQAREIFVNVLKCSMLLTAEEITFCGLHDVVNPNKPNVMDLCFYLLQGDQRVDPSQKMMALGASLSRSQGLREQQLSDSIGSMSRFWDPSTRRTYLDRVSTVLNKLDDLRGARLLWDPDSRRDVYVGQLVQAHVPSVINMGSYYDPRTQQYATSVDLAVSQRLIRSFNYLLWDFIKARCNGWQDAGKRIPVFFDEVADVATPAAGEDVPNPLEEGTKEGRSRGLAYYLGSQYPSQMPAMVRHQVLSSRGKCWFGLQNTSDMEMAVSDLMPNSASVTGAITLENIKALPKGTCFATLPRRGSVTPPFLLRVPYIKDWTELLFAERNARTSDAVADHFEMLQRRQESV